MEPGHVPLLRGEGLSPVSHVWEGRCVCREPRARHSSPPALRTQETLQHQGLRFLYHLLFSPGIWTRVR